MKFSERLKQFRTDRGLTQNELAGKASITARSLQRYESGASFPRMPAIEKLAEALEISVDTLLGKDGQAIANLGETEGTRVQRDFIKQAEQFSSLMAGGEIPDEDKEAAFMMIMKAYTIAKEKNKVFTPKKYRKGQKNDSDAQ